MDSDQAVYYNNKSTIVAFKKDTSLYQVMRVAVD